MENQTGQVVAANDNNPASTSRLKQSGPRYYEIGRDRWSRESFQLATPELLQEFEAIKRRRAAVSAIKVLNWDDVPTDAIEQILSILNDLKK